MRSPISVLITIYYQDDQIKDEIGGICSTYEEMRNAHKSLIRKPDCERSLGRPRHGWDGDIEILYKYGVRMKARFIWPRIGSQ
jgi:hypothetical protein